MLGLVVAFGISWLLLYLFERANILAIGFLPISKRLKQFLIGFFIASLLCIVVQYTESLLKNSIWIFNEKISGLTIVKSFWWDFKSILTEELIFRGAVLYILIQKTGSTKSVILSAIAFGIYHWFSYGVIGNIQAMVLVFIGTGLMGYAWAWAFAKTKSIMLPLGLHLGWNFVHNTVFSKGPLGDLLLTSEGGNELTGWFSLMNLIFVPILVLIYVKYFVTEEAN